MNNVLFEYLNDFVQAYFDDVLIYNKTRKKHIEHVRKILKKLIDADLQMNIKKCEFYVQKISFLDVLLFIEDIRIDLVKIQMILAWVTPTCLKEIQAFVDFYNFYRRFIRNFFKIVRFMLKLTQKDISFNWSEACRKSFESFKKTIIQTSILRHFDKFKKVVLKIDSSDYVNEGVLSQYDDKNNLHSVIFYSKNLLLAECNYEIYNKEFLIIVRCLKHWHFDLKAIEIFIEIFIDHKNLKYFMTSKELIRRQARWAEKLSEYNFKIMYQSGIKNAKIDVFICRADDSFIIAENDRLRYQHQTILTSFRLKIHSMKVDEKAFIYKRIQAVNRADEKCECFRRAIRKKKKFFNRISLNQCFIENELLFHQKRLWVLDNSNLLMKLIQEIHDQSASDHFGVHRIIDLLRRHYYWSYMRQIVEQYIRNCYSCHRSKAFRDKYNDLLISAAVSTQQWIDIFINFITDLSESEEHNVICIIVDKFIRERHYEFCKIIDDDISTEAATEILIREVFRYHDLSTLITSDRGPQFVVTVWKAFCRLLKIICKLSTIAHFEIDDQTERANQNIEH